MKYNINDIADKIERLINDAESSVKLGILSKQHAKNFSLGKTAQETIDLYGKTSNRTQNIKIIGERAKK